MIPVTCGELPLSPHQSLLSQQHRWSVRTVRTSRGDARDRTLRGPLSDTVPNIAEREDDHGTSTADQGDFTPPPPGRMFYMCVFSAFV